MSAAPRAIETGERRRRRHARIVIERLRNLPAAAALMPVSVRVGPRRRRLTLPPAPRRTLGELQ
jgi:hypothetical protein